MYYFAYGSNMDEKDLKEWCESKGRTYPEWKLLGIACLENYELSFNYYSISRGGGVANIMESTDSKVYGVLFEVCKEYDLETVRIKEGHPKYYVETPVTIKYKDENITNVKTYKVAKEKEKLGHQRPTRYYMDLILKNARKNEFPIEYVQVLERIETQ